MEQQAIDFYINWVQEHFGCEVYLIDDQQRTNGFAEYRNGGHVVYILADSKKIRLEVFLDILAHEIGHVLYNQQLLNKGMSYSEIVDKTQIKLNCFQNLLDQKIITDEEYTRLYASIEEEWFSNREKESILKKMKEEGVRNINGKLLESLNLWM